MAEEEELFYIRFTKQMLYANFETLPGAGKHFFNFELRCLDGRSCKCKFMEAMVVPKENTAVPCPRDNAGLLSRWTFWWFNPMIKLALERNLHLADLPEVPDDMSAEQLCGQIERTWDKSIQESGEITTKNKSKNTVLRVVSKEFLRTALASATGLWLFVLARIASVMLLQQLMTKGSTDKLYAYKLLFGIAVLLVLDFVSISLTFYYALTLGLKLRVSLTMFIYKKMLWLKQSDLPENSLVQVLNIFTNDMATFNERLWNLSGVIVGPSTLVINAAIMWWYMGWYSLIGVLYLVLYICYLSVEGRHLIQIKQKLALLKGERIQVVLNVLHGIKLIKMYTWELHFERLVSQARRKELLSIRKLLHHRIVGTTMYIINGRLTFTWILLPYIFLGNRSLSEYLFPTLACCNIMRTTVVNMIIASITSITDMYVALQRMQDFIVLCENRIKKKSKEETTYHQAEVIADHLSENSQRNADVLCQKEISFAAKPGDHLAIVGKVGSGKTLLLLNLLKEVEFYEGSLEINGKMAYVPQEPWIFSGTIQENILFGQPYDKMKLAGVLGACALLDDIKSLSKGLDTDVGERGVNLSGGQKARVNMARAVYSDADIFLLDDPFSAVDVTVGRHLYDNCIQKYLKDKIVFLTTHHTQYIRDIKQIILIENGYSMLSDNDDEKIASGLELANSPIIKDEEIDKDMEPEEGLAESPSRITLNVNANDISAKSESEASPKLVSLKTHWKYLAGESSIVLILPCFLLIVAFVGLGCIADMYLKILIRKDDDKDGKLIGALFNEIHQTAILSTTNYFNTFCYIGTFAAGVITTYVALMMCGHVFQKSSKGLHKKLLDSTLRAKPSYFHTWHIGTFIDCFAVDIGLIDLTLPASIIEAIGFISTILASLILMAIINQWALIPSASLLLVYVKLCVLCSKVSRNFLQLESSTRGLIYSKVAATMAGLPVIHSLNKEHFMIETFRNSLNKHCSASYCSMVCFCWNQTKTVANSTFNSIVILVIVAVFISDMSSATIGLLMASLFMLLSSSILGSIEVQQAEHQMHAVERVIANGELEPEAPLESTISKKPPPSWPSKGDILLKDVSVWYTNQQRALTSLSFRIEDKEKVGIAGRTGAGKSSFVTALLRWVEPEGSIDIDGVTINEIGLHDLRSKISIITQDPVLFNGSIRLNLDPFDAFSDDELYKTLKDVRMIDVVANMSGGLSTEISDDCTSLSVGEKQLLCLARVILRKSRILLLDEATANIDKRTDSIIQETIREKFKNCTVLTIAHRLETIMDYDRILVLDNGQVAEFDEPYALLKRKNGHLFRLLQSTGKFNEELLLEVAKEAHDKRSNAEDSPTFG